MILLHLMPQRLVQRIDRAARLLADSQPQTCMEKERAAWATAADRRAWQRRQLLADLAGPRVHRTPPRRHAAEGLQLAGVHVVVHPAC